jgi:hypothetical protein
MNDEPTPTIRLYSIGKLSERLQRSPAHIEAVVESIGIKPSLSLNDQQFYSRAAELLIDNAIRAQEIETIRHRRRPE